MPFSQDYVLCFGRDHLLLKTRCQLLEQAGYATLTTSDILTVATHLISGDVSILVLCHSLTDKEVEIVSKYHREMHSPAAILCLSSGLSNPVRDQIRVCDAHRGPAAFLAAVAKLNSQSKMTA